MKYSHLWKHRRLLAVTAAACIAVSSVSFGLTSCAARSESAAASALEAENASSLVQQAQAMLDIACALTEGSDPQQVVEGMNGQYVRAPHRIVTKENVGQEIAYLTQSE